MVAVRPVAHQLDVDVLSVVVAGPAPVVGRLVRSAADNVDRVAEVSGADVLATLADFGRRQPVAFFGGAVVAGFLVARFFKSDAPLVDDAALYGDRAI